MTNNTPNTSNWEEEFEKVWKKAMLGGLTSRPVREFITTLRIQDRAEVIEIVEEMKNTRVLTPESSRVGKFKTEGYHKALKDIVSKLKER